MSQQLFHLKSQLNSFCLFLFTYLFLFSLSLYIPNSLQKYGILNNRFNLVELVQNKARAVTGSMHEINLGLNFIGNFHKLSPLESHIFQSSGLVHLLAISGAQILPLVSLISFFISSLLYMTLKNKIHPHHIMLLSSKTRTYISFFISFFIAILFGGTGALMRVSWLNFFKKINLFYYIQFSIFKRTSEFSEPLLDKIFILFVISLIFGNIFNNYSFILSAIGASCAEISAYACNLFLKANKNSCNLNILNKIIAAKFFVEIIVTISTCVFVGIILAPLTYNSILNSCLANIFAIPLITFLVTPLALLVLIIPINNVIFDMVLKGLDYSLILFKHIALVFSEGDLQNNSTAIYTQLFSPDGLIYLNLMMIVLWVIVDLIRGRKVYLMRCNFVQANSKNLK